MTKNHELLDQYEIGGNFFELIEFSLNRRLPDGSLLKGIYGVNVAKVREVVHMPKINPLASRIPGVAGIFELRGVPIPAINLCRILGDYDAPVNPEMQIVVTEFSEKRAGFIVSTTHRIRRIAWEKVLPPSSDAASCMSGMILIEDNQFLFILDLEMILNNIEVSQGQAHLGSPYGTSVQHEGTGSSALDMARRRGYVTHPDAPGILFVDDSKLVLNNVGKALLDQGYRLLTAENGVEALEKLQEVSSGKRHDFGPIHALITDVEMPLMDGLTLVKKVRQDRRFADLPILLHTSLSGEVTQAAGQAVGASGYIIKNDIQSLLLTLKDHLAQAGLLVSA
jgi:two-component system, chemotaxis family, chemotaxis protein CheV